MCVAVVLQQHTATCEEGLAECSTAVAHCHVCQAAPLCLLDTSVCCMYAWPERELPDAAVIALQRALLLCESLGHTPACAVLCCSDWGLLCRSLCTLLIALFSCWRPATSFCCLTDECVVVDCTASQRGLSSQTVELVSGCCEGRHTHWQAGLSVGHLRMHSS